MEVTTCDSGKITFETYKEAKEKTISLTARKKKNKFTVYKCSRCEKFHFSTTTKKLKDNSRKYDKYPISKDALVPAKKENYSYKASPQKKEQGLPISTGKIMTQAQAATLKRIIENTNPLK